MDQKYIDNYIKFIWIIISSSSTNNHYNHLVLIKSFNQFNSKYGEFLKNLIINSQISKINLIISTYYLYKYYHSNNVLKHEIFEESNNSLSSSSTSLVGEISSIHIYNIIISLILSNKSFDDQSYTLKTWLIIIKNTLKQQNHQVIAIDLKLLNLIENYFLNCLNYNLNYIKMSTDFKFWNLIEFNKIFKIDLLVLIKFKNLVLMKDENELISPSCHDSNCYVSSPISKHKSNSPSFSTFSSPLNYPLTPKTPLEFISINSYNSNLLSNPSSCKKRKIVPMLPSQEYSKFNSQSNYHQQQQNIYQNITPITLPLTSTDSFNQYQQVQQIPQISQAHHYQPKYTQQNYIQTQTQLSMQLPPPPSQQQYYYQPNNQTYNQQTQQFQQFQPIYNQTLINPFNNQQYYNSYW
ncbi:uncharacterized protein KGF55_001071 [Candida pseudojiufengensis]|uniref:uncharacterized protein n=1 Tax=Candida pseudojiufengensis TaxID=497109 RepID=UPI0022242296|nr:uncharacterized protein KGF55_001071 [Candida pseudojiufengensis]KAI5965709.1 hypothetical protein KGF55_001071 [Candida pseudojiufengensis]